MNLIETKMLVGEIAKRHGIRLDADDPAVAIVSLNELILEKCLQEICDHVRTAIGNLIGARGKRRRGQRCPSRKR
jgi:hypothetical protein